MKKYSDYCKESNNNNDIILSKYSYKNIIVYGNNYINNYKFTLNNIKTCKSELKYSEELL